MDPSTPLTLPFSQIGAGDLPVVGGKGANLGVLASAGFPVPSGFCVTTRAYERFLAALPDLDARFAALDALDGADVQAARGAAEAMREALGTLPVPGDVADSVLSAWREAGPEHAYAVRSSATAEDLPGASFAGQQDTYLNIRGEAAILDAVRRCWISLFTDRAVLYRAKNGFGHRGVSLSVVVQRMVLPQAAGILFTADPISGHRGIVSIDAGFGLGEALVSGLVSADLYRVEKATGRVVELKIGDKALAIRPKPEGGTWEERLSDEQRHARVLDDAQVAELARMGAAIEAHYGGVPQDVEWCLEDGRVFVVQARPITSLFPLPPPPADGMAHVYLHFGHLQMMTDPMSPMGRELWRRFIPVLRDPATGLSGALTEAASRIFLDPTPALRIPPVRRRILGVLGHVYGPAAELLALWVQRPELRRQEVPHPRRETVLGLLSVGSVVVPRLLAAIFWAPLAGRHQRVEDFLDRLLEDVRAKVRRAPSARERLVVLRGTLGGLLGQVAPRVIPEVAGGIIAMRLLERATAGLATPDELAVVGRGLQGNVTTEMDQQVADLADLVRGRPELEAALRAWKPGERLADLRGLPGGDAFASAWDAFFLRYGMRAAGEIDLARPRWRDDPSLVIASILGNLAAGGEPGAHRARQERQAREAELMIGRLSQAADRGFLGWARWRLVARLGRMARVGMALREHPKFALVRILDIVRGVALEAGASLVAWGRLERADDVFLLRLERLERALEDDSDLRPEVARERAAMALDAQRSPPLAMTSQGEILTPPLPKDLPPGAMAGVAASAGTVEGVARVILDPGREVLHAGEILVAPYTDPGWTPLFVHAAGLVTEVGGLMTHGSVVAREYGIPAVVSVAGATTKIRTGDRLRVDGTRGLVVKLEP